MWKSCCVFGGIAIGPIGIYVWNHREGPSCSVDGFVELPITGNNLLWGIVSQEILIVNESHCS